MWSTPAFGRSEPTARALLEKETLDEVAIRSLTADLRSEFS